MEKKRIPLISFLLAILLWFVFLISKNLAPFGTDLLFMSDLGAQYLPFLAEFRDMLLTQDGFLYSFHNGIGGNMLPLMAYYVTSPFNLLVAFFTNETLPIFVHLLMGLKISLAAAAMGRYLIHTYQKRSWMAVLLAVVYSFSGFTAAYFYNIMWLDALIWLPVVTLALQRLLDEGKKTGYILSLFILIWSNYYLGYMVCLFLAFYAVYWTLITTKNQKLIGKKLRRFIGSSLIGAMLTGVLLVPTIFGMMTTGKGEFDFSFLSLYPTYGLDGLAGFGVGISDFTTRLRHLPTLYSSLTALLLVGVYAGNSLIPRKTKRTRFFFLGFLLLTTWLQPLLALFQAFQPAAGFPFRQSFLISFFLLSLAYESWLNRTGIQQKQVLCVGIAVGIVFLLALLFNQMNWFDFPEMSVQVILLNLLFVGASTILLGMKKVKKLPLALFILIELCTNFWLMTGEIPVHAYADYQRYVGHMETELADVEFARVDNSSFDAKEFRLATNGYNDGVHFSYPGVSAYTSTLAADKISFYQNLGLYSRNERRISYVGSTPLTDLLLSVGYRLEETLEPVPHFKFGFTVPSAIEQLSVTDDPFQNQNQLSQALFQTDVFVPVKQFEKEEQEVSFQTEAGTLYIWLPLGGTYKQVQVNGEDVKTKLQLDDGMLVPLGESEEGECVTLQLAGGEDLLPEQIQTFQNQTFDQMLASYSGKPLRNLTWENHVLEGTVEHAQDGELLLLSIPLEPGWQIEVDGKEVQPTKVAGGLIGVPLTAGSHQVRAQFIPPGLVIGLGITLLGLALFLYSIWAAKRKESSLK
ncbi:YfhO family protein [Jeotgalibaca caeni]|uniref:YfhO family protein n=1 Tax=Jeotgalibaca caeni TaxID=3028623 RepID=UPI00237EE02C|nr:YfhO family protein [Jeotgalibaca caeni]MDE1548897.1 YfhO family protein [Jeotgalibaca caeni]